MIYPSLSVLNIVCNFLVPPVVHQGLQHMFHCLVIFSIPFYFSNINISQNGRRVRKSQLYGSFL